MMEDGSEDGEMARKVGWTLLPRAVEPAAAGRSRASALRKLGRVAMVIGQRAPCEERTGGESFLVRRPNVQSFCLTPFLFFRARKKHTPPRKTASGDFLRILTNRARQISCKPNNRAGKIVLPLRKPHRVCSFTGTGTMIP